MGSLKARSEDLTSTGGLSPEKCLPQSTAMSLEEDVVMGRKLHMAEEIVAKLRQVDVLVAQGRKVAEAIRSIEVTEVTYYRWRSEGRSGQAVEASGD